jgi:mannosyltransferase OCH1-like enzyme
MPEYEIKCWDSNSLECIDNVFVKEAFEAHKWAFVADYMRSYALKLYGGIYLDCDVEVYKSFNDFLNLSFFSGTDIISDKGKVTGPEAGIIGAEPNHPFLDEFLKYYDNRHFIKNNGELDQTLLPLIMGRILEKYGYKFEDINQELPYNSKIFSTKYFCNTNSVRYRKQNYAFHKNSNSWASFNRGSFAKFCWKYGYMQIYRDIERLRIQLINKFK